MDTSKIIIETENLFLKPISLECKEDCFREFTPEITVFMHPKPAEKIEETIEYIEGAMKRNEAGTDFGVMILNKNTGEFFGNGGLHHINTREPELGIWIKKSAHGHGYGKEAMFAMKKWADENLDYNFIIYPVDRDNPASRRIPEAMDGKVFAEYKKTGLGGNKLNILEYRVSKNKK
jgi:RimJ/RimL family protein N-acetyltransferase